MKNFKKLSMLGLAALALTSCGQEPTIRAALNEGCFTSGSVVCEAIVNGDPTVQTWLVPVIFEALEGSTFASEGYNFYCGDFEADGKSASGIAKVYGPISITKMNVTDYGGNSAGAYLSESTISVVYMFLKEVTPTSTFKLNGTKLSTSYTDVYVAKLEK